MKLGGQLSKIKIMADFALNNNILDSIEQWLDSSESQKKIEEIKNDDSDIKKSIDNMNNVSGKSLNVPYTLFIIL
jgi:hypothetical protein